MFEVILGHKDNFGWRYTGLLLIKRVAEGFEGRPSISLSESSLDLHVWVQQICRTPRISLQKIEGLRNSKR